MKTVYKLLSRGFLFAAWIMCLPVSAETDQTITIQDHHFSPSTFKVPANQVSTITVKNLDTTPEEFESNDLKIEKIVAGGREITVRIPAVKAGEYKFTGEYHSDTATGTIKAE